MPLDGVEDAICGTPRVNSENPAAQFLALVQDPVEHLHLPVNRRAMRRTSVKADLPDVACLWHERAEKLNLTVPVSDDFRMQPQGNADARPLANQLARAAPCFRRGRHSEHESAPCLCLIEDSSRIRIQVDVAM